VTGVRLLPLDDVDLGDGGDGGASLELGTGPVVGIATHVLPDEAAPLLERLTFTLAPGGPGVTWVDAAPPEGGTAAGPARVLDDVLRLTEQLSVEDGLVVESLAFSALLAGPDFLAWRSSHPRRANTPVAAPVRLRRHGGVLDARLDVPERHNAFSAAMRDALVEALEIARWDESVTEVRLTGAGSSFSSGGDLDEFGTTPDVVTAHAIRVDRSAGLAVHRLRDRVQPLLHGACIGAGIEVPAFADHVRARRDAFFCLPELALGMIPGAGGTVSIARRIGRWRTAYLALTGRRIDAVTALSWGLVDELV
jgi:hypothetical protein